MSSYTLKKIFLLEKKSTYKELKFREKLTASPTIPIVYPAANPESPTPSPEPI
jgi:hypothetical protein